VRLELDLRAPHAGEAGTSIAVAESMQTTANSLLFIGKLLPVEALVVGAALANQVIGPPGVLASPVGHRAANTVPTFASRETDVSEAQTVVGSRWPVET
jgi:hypothetical protein